jgi:hypothetical protein
MQTSQFMITQKQKLLERHNLSTFKMETYKHGQDNKLWKCFIIEKISLIFK